MNKISLYTTSILASSVLSAVFLFAPAVKANTEAYDYTPSAEISTKLSHARKLVEFDYMQPFFARENSLPLLDLKLKLDNHKSKEINIGLAYRHNFEDQFILGAYGYFDHRNTGNDFSVNGTTIGAEMLSKYVDARANFYLPQNKRKKLSHNDKKSLEIAGSSIYLLSGGHLYETSLRGYDVEVGVPLFAFSDELNEKFGTKIYAARYIFTGKDVKAIKGARFRITQNLMEHYGDSNRYNLCLTAETQSDKVRKRQNFVGISFKITFNDKSNKYRRKQGSLRHRMMDTIIRDVDIVTLSSHARQDAQLLHYGGSHHHEKGRVDVAGDMNFSGGGMSEQEARSLFPEIFDGSNNPVKIGGVDVYVDKSKKSGNLVSRVVIVKNGQVVLADTGTIQEIDKRKVALLKIRAVVHFHAMARRAVTARAEQRATHQAEAANRLQNAFRGYVARAEARRRAVQRILEEAREAQRIILERQRSEAVRAAAEEAQRRAAKKVMSQVVVDAVRVAKQRNTAVETLQRAVRVSAAKNRVQNLRKQKVEVAATKVQSLWRSRIAQLQLRDLREVVVQQRRIDSAELVQRSFRGYQRRKVALEAQRKAEAVRLKAEDLLRKNTARSLAQGAVQAVQLRAECEAYRERLESTTHLIIDNFEHEAEQEEAWGGVQKRGVLASQIADIYAAEAELRRKLASSERKTKIAKAASRREAVSHERRIGRESSDVKSAEEVDDTEVSSAKTKELVFEYQEKILNEAKKASDVITVSSSSEEMVRSSGPLSRLNRIRAERAKKKSSRGVGLQGKKENPFSLFKDTTLVTQDSSRTSSNRRVLGDISNHPPERKEKLAKFIGILSTKPVEKKEILFSSADDDQKNRDRVYSSDAMLRTSSMPTFSRRDKKGKALSTRSGSLPSLPSVTIPSRGKEIETPKGTIQTRNIGGLSRKLSSRALGGVHLSERPVTKSQKTLEQIVKPVSKDT